MLKIDFQDGRWISNRHNFGYLRSRGHPVATVLVSNQIAQWFGSRCQKLFVCFSRWHVWRPCLIAIQHNFSYFSSLRQLVAPA